METGIDLYTPSTVSLWNAGLLPY